MTTAFSAWQRLAFLGALIAISIFGAVSQSNAGTLYYWDTNGSTPGGGSPQDGTWGEDPTWNKQRAGTDPTVGWTDGDHAVFSAGTQDVGSYTVTVSGTQIVGDIHFDNATPTLQDGTLALDNGNRLISAFSGVTATINSVIGNRNPNGVTLITKYKPGTLILGGDNTYSGATMIEGGILQLAAADRIPDGSNLILGNGDTRSGDGFFDTPATFHTGGFNETLGTLKLTGPNASIARTIDFGHGSSQLNFADSSAEDWEGIPLTIVNYTVGTDVLRFGTSSSGLTSAQLALIRFADYGNMTGAINSSGYVVPAGPAITQITGGGTANTEITWTAMDGATYQLQYKTEATNEVWSASGPNVTSSGSSASFTENTSGQSRRFYRVVLLP